MTQRTSINFDRFEEDKNGRQIPIWRKTIKYLTKAEKQQEDAMKELVKKGHLVKEYEMYPIGGKQ